VEVAHATAGWSAETLIVMVRPPEGGRGPAERLVVRLPPVDPSFPGDAAHALQVQAVVQEAVAPWVPAPSPVVLETDTSWVGTPFLVMPFVDGHVPDQAPVLDNWVTDASPAQQRALFNSLLSVMARLHRLDWVTAGLTSDLRGADGGPVGGAVLAGELRWWEDYLGWSAELTGGAGSPVLHDALAWCAERLPGDEPAPSLLWGDPRLGNLVVDDDDRSVLAVLDWELASIGPAEMDLAWLLVLEWSSNELIGLRVPGFPDHDETVATYQALLGREVADLGWHELFALTRSAAISNHQARMAARAGYDYVLAPDDENLMLGLLARRLREV